MMANHVHSHADHPALADTSQTGEPAYWALGLQTYDTDAQDAC